MTEQYVTINGREIGPGRPPYIIAEISGNHNGDINRAFKLLEAAANAGADAVKLQTYTPDTMTIDAPQEDFQVRGGPWDGHTLHALYKWAHTPWEWHDALFSRAEDLGITIFSTPFDETALEYLEARNVPAYKIASFEMTDLPLVRRIAAKGKPLIISTGMASLQEIEETLVVARDAGATEIVILHCVSSYPAPASQANLRTIPDLAQRFKVAVGLSDHTLGIGVAVASIALGAVVVEKHVTLRRADGGPDAAFSLEPEELTALVDECRDAYAALGSADYSLLSSEKQSHAFRRSVYVVENIAAGEVFTKQNIRRIRPGLGLPPRCYDDVLGKRASSDLLRGTALSWDLVEGGEH